MASKFIKNFKEIMDNQESVNVFLINGINLKGKVIYCDDSLIVLASNKHGKSNINPQYIISYS